MKNFLKKLKNNWLDYLIIFISVFAICFVYLFTAFYQPKENKQNFNKENIVKSLAKKEPFENNGFETFDSVITLGYVRSKNNNAEIIYFMNIADVEIKTYNGGTPNTQEYELNFETYIYSYAYYDLNNNYAVSSRTLYEFSVYTDETTSILRNMRFSISYFEYSLYDVYVDDIETFYADFTLSFDMYIDISDFEENVIYENEISYEDTDSETYNIVFSRTESNDYVGPMQNLVDADNRFTRYLVGGFIIPFEYENAYNDGYFEGTTETEDYYEELIIPEIKEEYEEIGYNNGYNYGSEIGYNNGYNDGVIAGSNNFNILNLIRSLFDLVWSVLSVEMLPNIKLIYIVAIPLVLSVLKFILGWFR